MPQVQSVFRIFNFLWDEYRYKMSSLVHSFIFFRSFNIFMNSEIRFNFNFVNLYVNTIIDVHLNGIK